tara:strand:- start:17 stop:136 length:120 start_codon:yes stop_codon:yes gene_type:complete
MVVIGIIFIVCLWIFIGFELYNAPEFPEDCDMEDDELDI